MCKNDSVHNQIKIIHPSSQEEFDLYYDLRWKTLREPWKKPRGSEKDELEEQSVHAMALDANNTALGVVRLNFNSEKEAQIRYMGVSPTARGRGIGSFLIKYIEEIAFNKGAQKIILHSRENAVQFYQTNGYIIQSKSYLMWDEIQHFLMIKLKNISTTG
jgi:predicted GNAT family N-acyltransferase